MQQQPPENSHDGTAELGPISRSESSMVKAESSPACSPAVHPPLGAGLLSAYSVPGTMLLVSKHHPALSFRSHKLPSNP